MIKIKVKFTLGILHELGHVDRALRVESADRRRRPRRLRGRTRLATPGRGGSRRRRPHRRAKLFANLRHIHVGECKFGRGRPKRVHRRVRGQR